MTIAPGPLSPTPPFSPNGSPHRMNRLLAATLPPSVKLTFEKPAPLTIDEPRGLQLLDTPDEETPVSTFVPVHYEQNYAYPLIVWLHGCQQSERDLPLVMRHVSTRNYVAISPRGTEPCDAHPDAFTWSDDVDSADMAEDRVFEAIALAEQRFSVHPNRIFLAGIGRGGTMAMRLAMTHPQAFAGVATINGDLPQDRSPFRQINAFRSLPVLMAGSKECESYPEANFCRDLHLLHLAGANLIPHQYLTSEMLVTDMLADLNRWIMEVVSPTSVSV